MTDHTDLIERLRRPTITPSVLTCREAADALAALVKERDAAIYERYVEEARLLRLQGQVNRSVHYHSITEAIADRDAALARVKRLEDVLRKVNDRFIYKQRGATHWDGCEESHPECAMAREIEAALAEGDKP